jgi:rhamnulokinase
MAGLFDGGRLSLAEVHRFENIPVRAGGTLYWNLLTLWAAVLDGLRVAATQYGSSVVSVGVDTWGVDFGLLGPGDELMGHPCHYRDGRTKGVMEESLKTVSREEIFEETGLQFMEFNSLFQLLAMQRSSSRLLKAADGMLMMADLFHWLLTGVRSNELTNASTTQLFNPKQRNWSERLISRFELPRRLFGDLLEPGTPLGRLRADVADEVGLPDVKVVLPCTHDTASAVTAVPAGTPSVGPPDWCYLSSGTWSLMGAEMPGPVISRTCADRNFTNEAGIGGTVRLLKNIAGLWLVQECRRQFQLEGRRTTWEELVTMAVEAPQLQSMINPDDPRFLAPADMPEAIRSACRDSGQTPPVSDGALIRSALESLALKSRQVLGWLEEITQTRVKTIHLVGGGARNRMLCQMTSSACGLPVVAGPVEATALGNLLVQAMSAGDVATVAEARHLVRESFPPECFEPGESAAWDEAYERFVRL